MTARLQAKPLLQLLLLLSVFIAAAPLSARGRQEAAECAPPLVRTAPVQAVEDDGTLQLAGGERVRLIGVMPVRIFDKATSPGALGLNRIGGEAIDLLRQKLLGRNVVLRHEGRPRDRYDRVLAQVFDEAGAWLQGALLEAGLARAYSYEDNRACIEAMLKLEQAARAERRGLWRFRAFRPLDAANPEEIARQTYRFALVEGQVLQTGGGGKWTFVNFSTDWKRDFTIAIERKWAKALAGEGFDLAALAGKRVRVRGYIERWNGPLIKVTHKEQIELIDDQLASGPATTMRPSHHSPYSAPLGALQAGPAQR